MNGGSGKKEPPTEEFSVGGNGSGNWTRTSDKAVNSRLLYQLSYAGTAGPCF